MKQEVGESTQDGGTEVRGRSERPVKGTKRGLLPGGVRVFAVAILLWGCAGLGKRVEPPRAQLANITVQEVRGFEAVLEVELRLFNSNDVPMEIQGIDCELEINDKRLASGVSKTETKVPAYGTATIPITLYSSVLDVVRRVMELPGRENVDYKLTGNLHLRETTFLYPSIPFRAAGEISLPGTPPSSR